MKYYHGTVDKFIPSIKREGLRPHLQNSWRMRWDSGKEVRDSEKVDAVYLSPSYNHAVQYAETRVRYFKAAPGAKFELFGQSGLDFTKDEDAPVLKRVKPVVLVLELDERTKAQLEPDPHDQGMAFRYPGTLQPSFIVEVKILPVDLDERPVGEEYDRELANADPLASLIVALQNYSAYNTSFRQ